MSKERRLPDGTVVHDFARVVVQPSKGKGGRLLYEVGNEFYVEQWSMGRIYDVDAFVKAWEARTEPQLVLYVKDAS